MDNVEGQLLGEAFSFQWGLKCFCLWNEKFLLVLGDYIPLFIFKQEKIKTNSYIAFRHQHPGFLSNDQ